MTLSLLELVGKLTNTNNLINSFTDGFFQVNPTRMIESDDGARISIKRSD